SKKGSYNGFWMKLGPREIENNFDATSFAKLTFWIKGDPKVGFPKRLKVELKGDPGSPVGKEYISGITSDWTKIEIALDDFAKQGVDLSKLNELSIVFEEPMVAPITIGGVYIDDIALEKSDAKDTKSFKIVGDDFKPLALFDAPGRNNVGGRYGSFYDQPRSALPASAGRTTVLRGRLPGDFPNP
ncbi:MAG: hypothetical protein JO317_04235, partial [Verrucomicrobiae bacterium]|nr:hypothetical protein [Verrucomicrobiae bacterium]